MIADIIHAFPSFTYRFCMNELSFKQFILWHMQALRVLYNIEIDLNDEKYADSELDKINEKFTWNEESKRWE